MRLERGWVLWILPAGALATCVRSRPVPLPDPPWSPETTVELDGGSCRFRAFATTEGFCRVRSFAHRSGDVRHGQFRVSHVGCDETTTVCGIPFHCSCTAAIAPFPCEPHRPDDSPIEDGVYSWDQMQDTPDRDDEWPEANRPTVTVWLLQKFASGGCIFEMRSPRYGNCKVRGGDMSSEGAGDWVDWIPFGGSKSFCGEKATCDCRGQDAGRRIRRIRHLRPDEVEPMELPPDMEGLPP